MTNGHILEAERDLVGVGDGEQVRDIRHDENLSVIKPRKSMVSLPVAMTDRNGFPVAIMALADILDRIDHRLEIIGLSATAASEAAGLSRDGIRNWKRRLARGEDKAGMNIRSLEQLAVILQTSVHWLQTGDGPETLEGARGQPRINAQVVPLLSWETSIIPVSPKAKLPTTGIRFVLVAGLPEKGEYFALRVNDDDMNLVSPVDSIIFIDHADQTPVTGGLYVIITRNGQLLYRQFEPPAGWRALSTDSTIMPINEPVMIAGRVLKTELAL